VQNQFYTIRNFLRLSVFMLVLAAFAAPVAAQSVRPPGNAVNLDDGIEEGPSNALGDVSDTEIWDNFRGGNPRDILAPASEGQVMTTTGQLWRVIREKYIHKYLGWVPVITIGILALFYLLRGSMKIPEGRSGKTVLRFSRSARMAHWFMAMVFGVLGFSGLVILLGRPLIAPYLGLEVNAMLTGYAMLAHNWLGPVFILALFWLFIKFVRGNFFQWVDLKWLLKFGGLFGGHVSSHKFNFGEKSWFWMVILGGALISATGILQLFPSLVEDVRWLQLSTILHAVGAVLLISVAIGHVYVGTIGMEGSIDGMRKGDVDENWAKAHHDLWYEDMNNHDLGEENDPEDNT